MKSFFHPDNLYNMLNYEKFRLTYCSGTSFIDNYLEKYTQRETDDQFEKRKNMTVVPAFARQAVDDVKNAIFQRMIDVVRKDGPESYQNCIQGKNSGVDRLGSSMNSFIGSKVLPELLSMGKVGVFIDRMPIDGDLLVNVQGEDPYLYIYRAEDIINWSYDESNKFNEFTSIMLRDCYFVKDDSTGLIERESWRYRHLTLVGGKVYAQFLDENQSPITEPLQIGIDRIPFVIFDIGQSLLQDIANYQIALMNMSSSDIAYVLQANFPFYTEMYDPVSNPQHLKKVDPETQDETAEAKDAEVQVGATVGRMYPKGMDRPQFIDPPTEPLQASIAKQDQLKHEIRELVNLALSNIGASAESKKEDQRGLESGLSYIGLVLENGERQIGDIWALYESSKTTPTISYPERYQLRTEKEIQEEIDRGQKIMKSIPSMTFKKEIAKKLACLTVGHKVSKEVLERIYKEIDDAEGVIDDVELFHKDLEGGLVSPEHGSLLRGYPEGEVEKAEDYHARRLARINAAQAEKLANEGAARGVKDLDGDPTSGKKEKAESRDTTKDDVAKDKTRGKGDSLKD